MEYSHTPIKTIADIQPGDHLFGIYLTDEEHRAVLTPFLRKDLEQNEKVFFELSERSIICEDMTVTEDGTGNNKQDEISSGVKNL